MAWIDSGSDFEFNDKEAKCISESKQSSKFNVMWEYSSGGATSGSHYYEVTVTEGDHIWIGVTDKKHLATGFKLRGMMYGGNTSNGTGLVTKAFGPSIDKGDTAGCLYEFTSAGADGETLTVTFFHNGKCLGPAFKITKKSWNPMFPVVTANKGGDAFKIDVDAKAPAERERPASEGNDGMIGGWYCEELSMTMNLNGNDSNMNAVAKIVNNVSFPLSKTGEKWEAGQPKSTMMAGPPDLTEKENKFESEVLPNPIKIELEGSDMLWKYAKNELKFTPYAAPPPQPSTADMLGA